MSRGKQITDGRGERSELTRRRIVDAARTEFAENGYSRASLNQIVSSAAVTTGAIYHHFKDKKGLFAAVAEDLEQEILDQVVRIPTNSDPWLSFTNGISKTLEVCARPDINRIVFKEAPSVIGPVEWREIELKYSFGLMRDAVTDLSHSGILETGDPDLTAQIILGTIIEAAHAIAIRNGDPVAIQQAKDMVISMITALRSAL